MKRIIIFSLMLALCLLIPAGLIAETPTEDWSEDFEETESLEEYDYSYYWFEYVDYVSIEFNFMVEVDEGPAVDVYVLDQENFDNFENDDDFTTLFADYNVFESGEILTYTDMDETYYFVFYYDPSDDSEYLEGQTVEMSFQMSFYVTAAGSGEEEEEEDPEAPNGTSDPEDPGLPGEEEEEEEPPTLGEDDQRGYACCGVIGAMTVLLFCAVLGVVWLKKARK